MSASATVAREIAISPGNRRAAGALVEILERGKICNTTASPTARIHRIVALASSDI
jgi:hypothetical protein